MNECKQFDPSLNSSIFTVTIVHIDPDAVQPTGLPPRGGAELESRGYVRLATNRTLLSQFSNEILATRVPFDKREGFDHVLGLSLYRLKCGELRWA